MRTDEDEAKERRVGWLELFYDLVFIVVIAELSHYLATHLTLVGVAGFILLFLPVWWTWISGTIYNDRFETNGLDNRVFTFFQMLPVAAMAVFAHDALGQSANGFALSYAAVRMFFVFLWWRAGRYEPRARPMTNRFNVGFSISVFLFAISIFAPAPYKFILWGIGLLVDLITPVFNLQYQKTLPHLTTTHLPLVLGIVAVGGGILNLVKEEYIQSGERWLITGGIALSLLWQVSGFWKQLCSATKMNRHTRLSVR